MSFNNPPIFEQITPNLIRITGLTLDSQASGTIGLPQSTSSPDVVLPASFKAPPFFFEEEVVSLAARIRVMIEPVSGAPGPFTNLPPSIEKTGTTPQDFLITIVNTNTTLTTQVLEIYIQAITRPRSCTGPAIMVGCGCGD